MANKNITDLPGGTFAAGHKFEMFNTAANQNQSVTIPAQSVQTQNLIDLSLSGNTAGVLALVSSGTAILAGGNNITLSQNGQSITISAGAGGAGGTNTLGMSNIGNTSGDTSPIAASAMRLIFAGGNNITLSQSTNGSSATVTISAFNQTVQTQNLVDVTLAGNTSGALALISSGTMTLAGGNNVTLSQAGNAVTISAGAGGAAGTNTIGMSTGGNTSGDNAPIAASAMRLIFAGGNNITLSQSTNGSSATITISAGAGAGATNTIGMSDIGNTSGDTSPIAADPLRVIFAGGNNITLSQSTNGSSATITISAAAAAGPTISFYNNMAINGSASAMTTQSFSFQSMGVFPLVPSCEVFPGNMTINTFQMLFTISGSTATMSSAWTTSIFVGLYTFNASTLSLLNSVSTSFGSNAGNANLSTQIAGVRWCTIHSSAWSAQPVLTAGHYWLGTFARSSGASCQSGGFYGQGKWPNNLLISGSMGVSQVNATSVGLMPFWGQYNTTTAALPTAIGSADINKQLVVGTLIPCVHLNNLIASF